VFVSFTLSQSSMVRYWVRLRSPLWPMRALLNGVGALATGVVMLIIATTKFTHGAWIVTLLIPCLVFLFMAIHRHYEDVALQLSAESAEPRRPPSGHTVLVLVGDVHRGMLPALEYAQALSPSARGVYVEIDPDFTRRLEDRWGKWGSGVPLVVLRSPYRSVVGTFLEYLDHLQQQAPDQLITIIGRESVPAGWGQHLLQNKPAALIKVALLFRKGIIVTSVPSPLRR